VVVVAYLGWRGSSTNLFKATELRLEKGQLVLEVEEPVLGPGCVTLQEERVPFVAVSLREADCEWGVSSTSVDWLT
jgi:hypothetical protein